MKFESSLAESVFRSKYLLEGETEPEQAVERLVKEFCRNFPEMENEAREYIDKQWYIPAGGIWRASGNPDKNVSHINCTTITPVEDNLESIFDSLYKWAKYAAYGQGEGIDISNLRPKNALVHNSSRSSTGAVSFMNLYDGVLKVIAQHGRRGASLISIKDTHPDILDFIKVKDKPESDKSRIDTANISIQVSDDFMQCVVEDKEWTLRFENKYQVIENKIRARDLFEEICKMAHKRGDPGLQFIDKMKRESNSDSFGDKYKIVSTNACAEQALDPENVCNLGHINLAKFNEFSLEGYYKLIRFGMYFGVSIIKNELADGRSPTKLQKEKLINMPRVGLGLTGLADYFIDNKIVYGSIASIDKVHQIFSDLARYSYKANCELGKKFGSFPSYDINKMKKSKFIQRLLENNLITDNDLTHQYCVACNTIAPVGSGSLIANVGGSGIEPIFSKYYVRRERSTTNEWKEWFTFNAYVERYLKEHNLEVTKENADKLVDDYWSMSYDVDNLQKIKLVAEAQRWIDSSISVTFNITEDATVEDVKQIYLEAWKNGLKGVTVYREGSLTGVLINEKNYEKSKKELESKAKEKFKGNDYVKRPDELACDIYEAKYKDDKFIVLVGINNGIPYEVFVTPNNNNEVDVEKYKTGVIKKIKSNHYDLIVQNGVHKTMVNNIGKTFDSLYGTVSRMVSMSLRHGVELSFIIDQLNKDSGFVAFEKVLSRILKKYVKDNTSTKKKCTCGADLIYVNGCVSCAANCGFSKCE